MWLKRSAPRDNGTSQPHHQQTGSGAQPVAAIYHRHGSSEGSSGFWICSVGPGPGASGINTSSANGEQL